jgi:hypothetical protein
MRRRHFSHDGHLESRSAKDQPVAVVQGCPGVYRLAIGQDPGDARGLYRENIVGKPENGVLGKHTIALEHDSVTLLAPNGIVLLWN